MKPPRREELDALRVALRDLTGVCYGSDVVDALVDADTGRVHLSRLLTDESLRLSVCHSRCWHHFLGTFPSALDSEAFRAALGARRDLASVIHGLPVLRYAHEAAAKGAKEAATVSHFATRFDEATVSEHLHRRLDYWLRRLPCTSSAHTLDDAMRRVLACGDEARERMASEAARQARLCGDMHFFSKMIGNTVVVLDPSHDDCASSPWLRRIVSAFQKGHASPRRPALLVVGTEGARRAASAWHNPVFVYTSAEAPPHLLPAVASGFVYATSDASRSSAPRPLAVNRARAVLYARNDLAGLTRGTTDGYDRIVTNVVPSRAELARVYEATGLRAYSVPEEASSPPSSSAAAICRSGVEALECLRAGRVPICVGPRARFAPYVTDMASGLVVSTEAEAAQALAGGAAAAAPAVARNVRRLQAALFSDACAAQFWEQHASKSCPVRSSAPAHGILLYLDFAVAYFFRHLPDMSAFDLARRTTTERKKNVCVLIDNRANALSALSLFFAARNLAPTSWDIRVVTSASSAPFYRDLLPLLPPASEVVTHGALEHDCFHIDNYNTLLTSAEFWDEYVALGYEKMLIVQDDGVLLRRGVERFARFDYVGAPWPDTAQNAQIKAALNGGASVGNGGLSLRSVSASARVAKTHLVEKTQLFCSNMCLMPEDVYFAAAMTREKCAIPDATEASLFSSEQIANLRSLGVHKVWVYHRPETTLRLFQSYLEGEN